MAFVPRICVFREMKPSLGKALLKGKEKEIYLNAIMHICRCEIPES
jgi:hypothetical protein